MTIGTKSVLYGAHAFWLHPWFVAAGWWTLYGFPWDPRLWAAFWLHDVGYVGKPNMDGPEGELHPIHGAAIMGFLFDGRRRWLLPSVTLGLGYWGWLTLLHSRYFAKTLGRQPSQLCMADKMALALTPAWLYLPMVRATGEIYEYMAKATVKTTETESVMNQDERRLLRGSQDEWYRGVQSYCWRWAMTHRDGREDTWTSERREPIDETGVWR